MPFNADGNERSIELGTLSTIVYHGRPGLSRGILAPFGAIAREKQKPGSTVLARIWPRENRIVAVSHCLGGPTASPPRLTVRSNSSTGSLAAFLANTPGCATLGNGSAPSQGQEFLPTDLSGARCGSPDKRWQTGPASLSRVTRRTPERGLAHSLRPCYNSANPRDCAGTHDVASYEA